MRYLFLTLALLAGACSACAAVDVIDTGYATRALEAQDRASVRIFVECGDGRAKLGSGVVVSPTLVLTADHVTLCDGNEAALFTVFDRDGGAHEAVVDRHAGAGVDVARLVLTQDATTFRSWARIGAPPRFGDPLCWIGGDSLPIRAQHCGPFTPFKIGSEVIPVISAHGAHGNSGSGVFNEWGELVGIMVAVSATDEHWSVFEPLSGFRHLVP